MSSAVRPKAIHFKVPMVRALLNGSKTQTRRIAERLECLCGHPITDHAVHQGWTAMGSCTNFQLNWSIGKSATPCPYGKPGDQLWVREPWRAHKSWDDTPPTMIHPTASISYEADGEPKQLGRYRTSRFMMRWSSRITLEVTDVRVQRLQAITEQDARAEGAPCIDEASGREILFPDHCNAGSWRLGFRSVWEDINGPGSWGEDPWVWAITFKRVKP